MYIGGTDARALHHGINEVLDNSVDEFLAGHCSHIDVIIHVDGSISIKDNGRGETVRRADKTKLSSRDAAAVVDAKTFDQMMAYFETHPAVADRLVAHCLRDRKPGHGFSRSKPLAV